MNKEFAQYEAKIKKKHSFGWTPKFEAEFQTDLNKTVVIAIVNQTFEKLGWELVFYDESHAEAKRKNDWDSPTEKISVTFSFGKLKIESESLGKEMWDNGRNSKRVKLFIYAFQETAKTFDREALVELGKEVEKINNWEDYEIPTSLPQPQPRKAPQFWIPAVGGIVTALLLAYILAFSSVNGFYFIILFEIGIAFALAFALHQFVKLSKFTFYPKLHYLVIVLIVIIYFSNQYFQYLIIIEKNGISTYSFLDFIQSRWKAGFIFDGHNTGWIGLIVSWAVQLVITYIFTLIRLSANLTAYQLKRIPIEVIDFTYYQFVKDKSEDQVRRELSKMGWKEKEDQDEVFETIGAFENYKQMRRM